MPTLHTRLPWLVLVLALTAPAAAQTDSIIAELDAFWAEVSRTVAEGDDVGVKATYHPDAVWVRGDPAQISAMPRSEEGSAGSARTRAGEQAPGVAFRFSSRLHDSTTAHEVGMVHFWNDVGDEPRRHNYGLLDSYLVKKDGRWMILVEIQRWNLPEADWQALASGRD